MKYTRRTFLGLVGATAAGAGLSANIRARVLSAVDRETTWYDREEKRISSICGLCSGGCGLSVRVVNSMPVKIDGNKLHPVNRGGLCPRGLAGLQSLYDPDRLIAPLRRTGPKGSGQWEEISWDEAVASVATPLAELRHRGRPEALAILGGEYRGLLDDLWKRFAQAYGTPNYIRMGNHASDKVETVARLMQGETRPINYDLHSASLVLSFGCNWLEGWRSPVSQMRAYSDMRQGRSGRRAVVIHVEPRLSYSAAKADLWIPVKPGTEGILALGIAHVILSEQLYDEDFTKAYTFGFDQWESPDGRTHDGFKRLVLEKYAPMRVSEITGVRPETIVTVARRLASNRPAIVLGDNRSALEGHNLFTRMAIHSLNALVGSIGVQGGILPGREGPPLSPWPEIEQDETSKRGLARQRLDEAGVADRFLDTDVPGGLAEAVLRADASPVQVLIIFRANPLSGRSDKERFKRALAKIPLVVSLSGVPNEVSEYADLILPEHHFLESWQDDRLSHLSGFDLFSVGRPCVDPLYNTQNPGDMILNLAAGIGGATARAFPWSSYEELLKSGARGLFESGKGYVASTSSDELFRSVLHRQGYRAEEFDDFETFWEALVDNGAWWDPRALRENTQRWFATPSGKFEFYPLALDEQLQHAAAVSAESGQSVEDQRRKILSTLGVDGQGQEEDLFFPAVLLATLEEQDPEPSFVLRTYELLSIGNGIGANLPWLQENLAAHIKENWGSWVEIHPHAAQEIGIHDGEAVWVESAAGRLRMRARLYEGTREDVVSIPVGLGHTAGGRWSQGRGEDPSDLVISDADPSEGLGIRKQTRVRITRA